MDKKELKQDLVRDRIIDFIEYLSEKSLYVSIVLGVLVLSISAFSFFSDKERKKSDLSSEISGLAQNEYNQGDIDFAISDLEQVLIDYKGTAGSSQAYIYLIYDAYINNDSIRLASLLDDYKISLDDLFLNVSIMETRANRAANEGDYPAALAFLDNALDVNEIESIDIRLNIAKARIYISNKEYDKAAGLLEEVKDSDMATPSQKNIIDELNSYILNIN